MWVRCSADEDRRSALRHCGRARTGLSCDPHAFLVACVPPALRHGERRVAIDTDICPELSDGLRTMTALLAIGRLGAVARLDGERSSRTIRSPDETRDWRHAARWILDRGRATTSRS